MSEISICIPTYEYGGDGVKYLSELFDTLRVQTLQDFNINHTNYYTTHSDENKELVEEIYSNLLEDNLIYKKKIKQLFDEKQGMFLADRYVIGTCPACGADSQFGDGCEVCGITYEAEELINPISTITNTTPVLKKTEHLYFKLNSNYDNKH